MTQPTGIPEAPESTTESSEPLATPEVQYIQLPRDPAALRQELARLQREDPDFGGVFTEFVGRKAEQKYTPQIKAKEAEIERLRMERRVEELLAMDENVIQKKFVEDPKFAREYTEAVHYKPEDFNVANEAAAIEFAAAEMRDNALEAGMPVDQWNALALKAVNGEYGDESVPSHTVLNRWQRDIDKALHTAASSSKPSTPQVNSALTKGGPVLSTGGQESISGTTTFPKSAREFNLLPKTVQRELLSTEEGQAKARLLT